ncbi:MAG: hypothetical protein AAFV49_04615 [Pseudomonadota bacterium]
MRVISLSFLFLYVLVRSRRAAAAGDAFTLPQKATAGNLRMSAQGASAAGSPRAAVHKDARRCGMRRWTGAARGRLIAVRAAIRPAEERQEQGDDQ